MHRLTTVLTVLLVAVAVAVFAAAGYVITNDDPVPHAGRTVSLPATSTSAAPSSTPSSSPSSSGPTSSGPTSSGPTSTPVPARTSVAFLGDDWTAGIGATSHRTRFSSLVAHALGVRQQNFGVDGTGYATSSRDGGDYLTRVPDVVAADPEVVVVSGGRNDVHGDTTTMRRAVDRLFTRLHDALPDATLIAVAPMWGDSDKPADLVPVTAAVRAAVTSVGGHYVAVPDPIHGHPAYMSDAADPDDDGYAVIATALTPRIRALLPS